MPGRGTQRHAIRVPPALWEKFGIAVELAGTDRATVIRELVRWWLREPGAVLPERPRRDLADPTG